MRVPKVIILSVQMHVDFSLRYPVHFKPNEGGLYVLMQRFTYSILLNAHLRSPKYLSQQCINIFLCISFLRTGEVPYALRYPEDFLACSLVMQAVIGHEDRLVFWGESVFWVHARNQNVDNSGRV